MTKSVQCMNNGVNSIDRVLYAVLNYDKHSLGLSATPCDLTGVSEKQYEMFSPSFDTRLDLVAYDLAWIIYAKHHNLPQVDDFKKFIKFNVHGRELFNKARELARPRLSENISYLLLTKTRKSWYNVSMLIDIVCSILFSLIKIAFAIWFTFLIIGVVSIFIVPTGCVIIDSYDKKHQTAHSPEACVYLLRQMH